MNEAEADYLHRRRTSLRLAISSKFFYLLHMYRDLRLQFEFDLTFTENGKMVLTRSDPYDIGVILT